MRRELALQQRLALLATLEDAVSAMQALAAHHFRLLRQALPAARRYRQEIEAMRAVLPPAAPRQERLPAAGLLAMASDLGLCGDYNARLAQEAVAAHGRLGLGPVYLVGRRLVPRLARAGLTPARSYEAPASLDGLAPLLLRLVQDLAADVQDGRLGGLHLLAARFDGVGHSTPVITRLLPVAPQEATPCPGPSPYVPADHLAGVVVRELLYITLHETMLDALAAEQGMRLAAAEGARQWLASGRARVQRQLAASRSEAATQEILDIVAGSRRRGER
ncbi:MAG: FoF1 ATP synthase subunit gamma [Thermodesulfobacteriota bacterium]